MDSAQYIPLYISHWLLAMSRWTGKHHLLVRSGALKSRYTLFPSAICILQKHLDFFTVFFKQMEKMKTIAVNDRIDSNKYFWIFWSITQRGLCEMRRWMTTAGIKVCTFNIWVTHCQQFIPTCYDNDTVNEYILVVATLLLTPVMLFTCIRSKIATRKQHNRSQSLTVT